MYDHVVELRSHMTELQSHCCTTVRFTSTVVDIHGIKIFYVHLYFTRTSVIPRKFLFMSPLNHALWSQEQRK